MIISVFVLLENGDQHR